MASLIENNIIMDFDDSCDGKTCMNITGQLCWQCKYPNGDVASVIDESNEIYRSCQKFTAYYKRLGHLFDVCERKIRQLRKGCEYPIDVEMRLATYLQDIRHLVEETRKSYINDHVKIYAPECSCIICDMFEMDLEIYLDDHYDKLKALESWNPMEEEKEEEEAAMDNLRLMFLQLDEEDPFWDDDDDIDEEDLEEEEWDDEFMDDDSSRFYDSTDQEDDEDYY
jgi:hypothetical protein